jgi:alpha-galactosidase
MAFHLENPYFYIEVDPARGAWGIQWRRPTGPEIRDVRVGLVIRQGRRKVALLDQWKESETHPPAFVDSPHGRLKQQTVQIRPQGTGLDVSLVFAAPQERPLFLWKMLVENSSKRPVFVERLELLRVGFARIGSQPTRVLQSSPRGRFQLSFGGTEPAFFSNGWGSWNYTAPYGFADRQKRSRLGFLSRPSRNNPGTPEPARRGHFSSDMFGVLVDRAGRTGFLVGFLSQKHQFGSIEALLDPFRPALDCWANGDGVKLAPGGVLETDWACLLGIHQDGQDPLEPYLDAVAREHGLDSEGALLNSSPTGWCSWYSFGQDIHPGGIRANLQALHSLKADVPLEIFQVDDGFQSQVGDWLEPAGPFKQVMGQLARDIQRTGFQPGLWLAPFIVQPRARIAAQHPGWFVRNRLGLPANAGYGWNNINRALDLSHPEVQAYLETVVRTVVEEWGYRYLKLDYLYAGAIAGQRFDMSLTRAQVLRRGLGQIRTWAGEETLLMGCGVPLGSAVGICDLVRIGADVRGGWEPKALSTSFFFRQEPNLPAVRNALQNTLTRAILHQKWWVNDPDCSIIGADTSLSLDEIQTQAAVLALTGGAVFLSDDLENLDRARLEVARTLLPPIGHRPQILDWLDCSPPARLRLDLEGKVGRWHLVAVINWQDQPQDLVLDPKDYYLDHRKAYLARSFWDGTVRRLEEGPWTFEQVPAHGCVLLALREERLEPQYLGSSFHISQGLEVSHWDSTPERLHFRVVRPGQNQGHVDLALPQQPQSAAWAGQHQETLEPLTPGVYRIMVDFSDEIDFELRF